MITTPDDGANINSGYVTNSPELNYSINLNSIGTHYIWVRGDAQGQTKSDSIHIGLDGAAVSTADRIDFGGNDGPVWEQMTKDGNVASLDISTTGEHKLNLWMREDGFIVDKIILTTDANYIPSGEGPVASDTTPPAPAQDSDNDGLPDDWELAHGLDLNIANDTSLDSDSDGLSLLEEYQNGTAPDNADSDSDGLPDGYEISFGLNPTVDDSEDDLDGDGESNLSEFENGTSPAQHAYTDPNPGFDEPMPSDLQVTFDRDNIRVDIQWNDNSSSESGFFIQRRINGSEWENLEVTAANVISTSDFNIQFGDSYAYRIAAIDGMAQTLFTQPVTVNVLVTGAMPISFIPRLGHSDGEYGLARYGRPVELDYAVPAGINRLVIIGFSYEQNTASTTPKNNYTEDGQSTEDKTIEQVYYGNVPLTRLKYVKTIAHEDGHNNHLEFWYMTESQLAEASGTDWEVTWFEEIDDTDNLRGFVATYANVDQENPIVDTQSAITSTWLDPSIGVSIEALAIGQVIAQTVGGNSTTAQWDAGLTEQFDMIYSGVSASFAVDVLNDGEQTVSVDLTGSTNRRALLAVSLRNFVQQGDDFDGDGLPNDWEEAHGLDPNIADDTSVDSDNDGLTLYEEYQNSTDPVNDDTDADGIPDGYEVINGLSPIFAEDADEDADQDGVSNLDEFLAGTDPNVSDLDPWTNIDVVSPGEPFVLIDFGLTATVTTDDQGRFWQNYASSGLSSPVLIKNVLDQSTAVSVSTTQLFSGASSSAGVVSGDLYSLDTVKQDYLWTGDTGSEEGRLEFSNLPPGQTFTFVLYGSRTGSGADSRVTSFTLEGETIVSDSIQTINNETGTVTLVTQADINGLIILKVTPVSPDDRAVLNALEIILGDHQAADSDTDGMPDDWETQYGYNPNDPSDAGLDLDTDGLTTLDEFNHETNPGEADSDFDGMPDGYEVTYGLSPTDANDAGNDNDNDGASNLEEYINGTDPTVSDTDALAAISIAQPGEPFALIDFGGAATTVADDLARVWTNYSGASAGDSGLLNNVLGDATGININTMASFSGASTSNGVTSGTIYSLNTVKQDYLWTGLSGTEQGAIEFTNLPVNETFTFIFYGSRTGTASDSRITEYTLTGQTVESGSIQTINNTDGVVILVVQPDNDGVVSLTVNAVAPDDRAVLNAVEIILGTLP